MSSAKLTENGLCAAVSSSAFVVDIYRPEMHLKSHILLKENIDALLEKRGMNRKDLAQWCRNSESWISKIFRNPNKHMPSQYLDRIADALGVAVYQLYQPGISRMAERRIGTDRRSGQERRIGHAGRQLATLRAEVDKAPRLASRHDHTALRSASPTAQQIRAVLTDAVRRIAPLLAEARGQAATARLAFPAPSRRRRAVRGSNAKKP